MKELIANHEPNKAISNDVFPEPVGPTTKFMRPRWNIRSSSILSTNFLFDGVRDPSTSLDQTNEAFRKPICDESTPSLSAVSRSMVFSFSVKESRSSVYRRVDDRKLIRGIWRTFRRKSVIRSSDTLPVMVSVMELKTIWSWFRNMSKTDMLENTFEALSFCFIMTVYAMWVSGLRIDKRMRTLNASQMNVILRVRATH